MSPARTPVVTTGLRRWRSRRPGWARRVWARNPRLAMAARAAIAAPLAWVVALAIPGPTADYPYYAPLGAVVATTFTLAGSVRESLQAVASIALGATTAFAVGAVTNQTNPLGIAVVVALGVLLAGWRVLGDMGSWVPTAALFTLIIGGSDPTGYIGAYTGLTLLGALIGVVVNLTFPPLPLAPAQHALTRVRELLAAQLADLADGLERDTPPDAAEWARRRRDLAEPMGAMNDAVVAASEARRWNRRTPHYDIAITRQDRMSSALRRAALVVEDLTATVTEEERADLDTLALGPGLRPPAARAMRALADVLRQVEGRATGTPEVIRAEQAVDQLRLAVTRAGADPSGLLVAASLVVSLRRLLEAVTDPPGYREQTG
ncbi:FUSC family protein [Georgenia yuyongxinii]|uniref:FUSC family protein n=1 Tax=Georgenia yuyongxinii TaxID=2589797 RepID=A0A552WL51_9MICO|nr:hypothetical protein [Georgenia yuyongxinii]TRW43477.1 hypothetical protein FJ693_17525 [Georgenia yuyongxinii]